MKTKSKKSKLDYRFITGITAIIVIVGGLLIWSQYQIRHDYDTLPQVNTPTGLLKHVNNHANDNQLTYEYYFRKGCKDCQHMAKIGIVPKLRKTSESKSLILINVEKFQHANSNEANAWFHANYVNNTPTLVVRSHGYAIYTYSGTDMKTFENLLNGINPNTNQPFKIEKHPATNVYQNDFQKSNSIIEAFRPKTLTSINN